MMKNVCMEYVIVSMERLKRYVRSCHSIIQSVMHISTYLIMQMMEAIVVMKTVYPKVTKMCVGKIGQIHFKIALLLSTLTTLNAWILSIRATKTQFVESLLVKLIIC